MALDHPAAGFNGRRDLLRAMLHHGRMALRPTKIRELAQLQAIIARAKELEGGAS